MKRLFLLIALVCSLAATKATSHTAASASFIDVSNKCAVAIDGDIVFVPAGGVVWTNVLHLTKGITLVGAGTNLTFITNSIPLASPWSTSLRPPLVWIQITNDVPVRVTQFNFFCNQLLGGQGIVVDQLGLSGHPVLRNFRVDHCTFNRAKSRAIEILGAVYGVYDHDFFQNCELTTEPVCGSQEEWNRFTAPYYALGTTNNIVVEDCIVQYDPEGSTFGLSPAPMATGQGGHYVFRFNTVLNTSAINVDGLDVHGNNYYSGYDPGFTVTPQPGWRGSICAEIYGNTFNVTNRAIRSMNIRGGTSMVYSNTFIGAYDSVAIMFNEEESWDTNDFNPLRSSWPAQDQITNTFVWANTINGLATNYIRIYLPPQHYTPGVTNPVAVFVQENRDFWRRAPTVGDAVAAYTPLVYPHPLVTSQPSYLNSAPTITQIADQSIVQDTATSALAFTIGDAEDAASALTLSKSSSNTTVVPSANVVFGGSGASRTVTVTPAGGQTGSSTIGVTVTDSNGLATSITFLVNVTPTVVIPATVGRFLIRR